jgi:L-threonylcarbamoyladenylate synthase
MRTELLNAERAEDVQRAASLLRGGALVAFPTETVYGLGALAADAAAVAALSAVKQRPSDKPFTLLVASPDDALALGRPGRAARALAEAFWPGPLTLVIADGRGGNVGVRCPDCPATLALLRLVGDAVAGPSANVSGREPATDAAQVLDALEGRIAAVLDGGPARLAVPSTVVRALSDEAEVLREGAIPSARIRAALTPPR